MPAYMDKNSDAYAVAERYLRLLYPGVLAQDELDAALEESISEAESEYEEAGQEINVEDYVELEETIDVRVLMPLGATIGYGHLIKPSEDFSKGLTEREATELFQQDLQSTYNIISKQVDHNVLFAMPQHQYDALVSLVFNIGPGSAATSNANRGFYQSTIRKYINDKDYRSNTYPTQESAWKAFRNHGMLDSRRDAEWRLYQNNDYSGC